MKYVILLSFCILSFSLSAQTVDYNIDRAAAKNISLYKMDATQAAAYKEILKTKVKAYKAATSRKDKSRDPEAIALADKEYETSFKAILNEDQKDILTIQHKMAEDIKARALVLPESQKIEKSTKDKK